MKDLNEVLDRPRIKTRRSRHGQRRFTKPLIRGRLDQTGIEQLRRKFKASQGANANDPMFQGVAHLDVGQIDITFRVGPTDDVEVPDNTFPERPFAEIPCLNAAPSDGKKVDEQKDGIFVPRLLISDLKKLGFMPVRIAERYQMEGFDDRIFEIRFLHSDYHDEETLKDVDSVKEHLALLRYYASITWSRISFWQNPQNEFSPHKGSVIIQLRRPSKADPTLKVKINVKDRTVSCVGHKLPTRKPATAKRRTTVKKSRT